MMGSSLPLAQFWSAAPNSAAIRWAVIGAFLFGVLVVAAMTVMPRSWRKPVVAGVTFLSGLFWVLYYFWPKPFDIQPDDVPRPGEQVGYWLNSAVPVVSDFAQIITAFLLGLGIYSLVKIHGEKVLKRRKDWSFSVVLLLSMVTMAFFGYWNWLTRKGPDAPQLQLQENWGFANYGLDFLFDGLLQQMDAAMFSIIAFYILSAAYRAFRIRSVEATILLATALVVMLSFMGLVQGAWDSFVEGTFAGGNKNSLWMNFTLTEISGWLRNTVQNPGIRAIEFGIGIGALAMGLRLWLSLERGGTSSQ